MIDKDELLKMFTEEIRLALEQKTGKPIDPSTTMEQMIEMVQDDEELIASLKAKIGRK